MKLYNQLLMEHYHHPKNYKKLAHPNLDSLVINPLCGDKIHLEAKVGDGIILEVGFSGEGCIISLATASILFDKILNQKIASLMLLSEKDVLNVIKLELGPNRLKCALLPLEAIKTLE